MSLFGKSPRDSKPEPPAQDAPAPAPHAARDEAHEERAGRGAPSTREGASVANIGKSITIKGDLTGNEDLEIDGNVEGRIDLPNNQLTIGAEGEVKAEVTAKAVTIVGHVTGNVSATEKIEVSATGHVDGDVRAPRLVIAEGAVLNGSVEMGAKAGTPATTPQATTTAAAS